jgi:hypothetical protein
MTKLQATNLVAVKKPGVKMPKFAAGSVPQHAMAVGQTNVVLPESKATKLAKLPC